jgi:hypothetical protein
LLRNIYQLLKVGKTGKVIGIEHIDELVAKSIENIRTWNKDALDSGNLKLIGIYFLIVCLSKS